MTQPLAVLVGRFIHHCGALELLTNNAIIQLSEDAILATEAVRAPLARRIVTLRRLLLDRTALPETDILALCNSLDTIRKKRNMVAHNPIASSVPGPQAHETILIVRHDPKEGSGIQEMEREEVGNLVKRSNALLRRYSDLFPAAATDEKQSQ